MTGIQKISVPNFRTHSGTFFNSIKLYYQHFGQALGKSPVVLVNHSLTGDAQVCGPNGWWKEIIGTGKTIDTQYYAVLAFNIPGNGTKGQIFSDVEDFHAGDIASLFLKGLDVLKIDKLYALIGGSIGGGIGWEMAALSPNLMQYLIPVAADWKANDWIIANTFLQKRILENSKNPIEDARIHAMLTYRTPESFSFRFGRSKNQDLGIYNIESWLLHHAKKLAYRFDLASYLMVNHLLASINIERSGNNAFEIIKKINAEIHLIAVKSDLFFISQEDQNTYEMIKPHKDNIYFHELKSIHGHDAFLIENEAIAQILKPIFKHKKT